MCLIFTREHNIIFRVINMNKINKSMLIEILKDVLYSIAGCAMICLSLSVFTVPNDIAPGGISGLSTALAHVTPIRVSVWMVILNVPLLLCSWKTLGHRPFFFALFCALLMPALLELMDMYLPKYMEDRLLASIFGGVLAGIGVGIMFIRGISTGGTDLIVLMIKKIFMNTANGTLLLLTDGVVVVIATIIFGNLGVALTSSIAIYASAKAIDAIAQGVDYAKVIYVITEKRDEILSVISDFDRGSTVIETYGGYTGKNKSMIVSVTHRNVLSQTLQLIKRTDPAAFIFVTDSTEVHGKGFKLDELTD